MKRICILATVFTLMVSSLLAADDATAPSTLQYSAVAYGTDGQPMKSKTMNLQISILSGTATGSRIYREYHTVTSDNNGKYSFTIGAGQKQLGLMSNAKWLKEDQYLDIAVEMTDTSGVTSYKPMSTAQIVIMPVKIKVKEKDMEPEVVEEVFSHHLGENFQGGVIVHLWKDPKGYEHGLIASLNNKIADSTEWSNISSRFIGTNQLRSDGETSTKQILEQEGHTNSAAKLVSDFTAGEYSDWYLPGVDELKYIWEAKEKIAKKKEKDTNYQGNIIIDPNGVYWTSTEYNADEAMTYDFTNGSTKAMYKYTKNRVVAFRKF